MSKNDVTDTITEKRERALARLWEVADLDLEATGGDATAQVNALYQIAMLEGLLPDGPKLPGVRARPRW